MESTTILNHRESEDVRIVNSGGREIIIVGTAHISKASADLVREVIEKEKPSTVCLELDPQRYKALKEKKKWEELDLKTIIKNKQLGTLMINILLASYQKKLGEKLGVKPGVELLEGAITAEENGIPVELCDRDVRITLKRTWNSMGFWQKMKFLFSGVGGLFEKEEISEEKLAEIKQKDVMTEMLDELGQVLPVVKKVLIDERDSYLAEKIKRTPGNKIVAVVGAGHQQGIVSYLEENKTVDLESIEKIPPSSPLVKIIGWGIPLLIIGSIAYIGFNQGGEAAGDNALFWILANGIPSAIGAIIAFGHPFTVISTFFAAPLTSLSPLIGAGYVAAFVQVFFKPPQVKELQSVSDDFNSFSKWWSNKLLRVLLVFILSGLGSVVGTYVGAYEIITNLFR